MPNPWILLGIVLAWLASLAGVGWWQRVDGEAVERSAWQARENVQLATAGKRILALEQAAREQEQEEAARMAAIAGDYEGRLQNVQTQRDRDVAAAHRGTLRLRDPGAPSLRADGCSGGPATAGAGVGDGPAPGELSRAVTADLFSLVDDANAVVEQLTACQAVVRADRAARAR